MRKFGKAFISEKDLDNTAFFWDTLAANFPEYQIDKVHYEKSNCPHFCTSIGFCIILRNSTRDRRGLVAAKIIFPEQEGNKTSSGKTNQASAVGDRQDDLRHKKVFQQHWQHVGFEKIAAPETIIYSFKSMDKAREGRARKTFLDHIDLRQRRTKKAEESE